MKESKFITNDTHRHTIFGWNLYLAHREFLRNPHKPSTDRPVPTAPAKPLVTFEKVAHAIRSASLPMCDAVIGIGSGGVVPASLVAYHLDSPLHIIWFNYRANNNKPQYQTPRMRQDVALPANLNHILLVDDVAVTGKTLATARARFLGIDVTTLVLKGKADIVLFPTISTCVQWPWHLQD